MTVRDTTPRQGTAARRRPTADAPDVHDAPADDVAARGLRLLAAAVAAVAVAGVGAWAVRGDAPRPLVPAGGAVVLATLGAVAARRGWGRGLATTSALVAVALGLMAARLWLTVDVLSLDAWLLVGGAVAAALGYLLRERRLAALALAQWAALVGRPVAGGEVFRHCLIATELAVPLPRLDPLLVLGIASTALGLAHRLAGRHIAVGRGWEIGGGVTVTAVLLLKAAELPGLAELCGAGDALDDGWAVAVLLTGVAAGAWGAVTRDAAWAAIGLAGVTLGALVAVTLSGDPWWALAAFLPLAATFAATELRGVRWARDPGYGLAAPRRRRSRRG